MKCEDLDLNKKYFFHYVEKYSYKLNKTKTIQIFDKSIYMIDFVRYIFENENIEINVEKIEYSYNDQNIINIYGFLCLEEKAIPFFLDLSKEEDTLIIRNFITECLISQRTSLKNNKDLEWFLKIGEENKKYLVDNSVIDYIENDLKSFLSKEDNKFLKGVVNKYADFPNSDSLGILNITYNFIKKDFYIKIIHFNRSHKDNESRQINLTISKSFFSSTYPNLCIQIDDDIEIEDYMAYAMSKETRNDFETIKFLLEANTNKFDFKDFFESLSINKY